MYYKKPAFGVIVVAVIFCLVAGICLLTAPESEENGKHEVVDEKEDKPSSLYSEYEMLAMIHEILNTKDNPGLSIYSFVGPYIEAHREVYQKLVDNGEATLEFFADFLRYTERSGFGEAVMTAACMDIMEIPDSSLTSDWLDEYDKQQKNEKVIMEKISFESNSIGLSQLNDMGKEELFGSTMKADLSTLGELTYLPIIKINTYKEFKQFNQQLSNYSDLSKSVHGTEAYASMTQKYDEQYFKNQALFMVYMPIVNYNGAPFVQSVKKSSDGKGIVVRVDIDGKQEGIKEEKSWFLTVEIDKELVDSCTFMTALFNRIESKTYYLNGENEESHDVWKAEFSLNIYDSGFRFRSEYPSETSWYSGYYQITEDTLTLNFAKKTGRDKGGYKLVFRIEGENYVLDAKRSTKIPEAYVASTGEVKSEIMLPDGAVFKGGE